MNRYNRRAKSKFGKSHKALFNLIVSYMFVFILFSMAGWLFEVFLKRGNQGVWINPGFQSGPFLPIYGFSAIILFFLCEQDWRGWQISLAACAIITTIEFIVGYYMFHLHGIRLWDYTDMPFNLYGYICLPFTLLWGLIAVVVYYWVYPWIKTTIHFFITNRFASMFLFILFGIMLGNYIDSLLKFRGLI